MPFHDVEQGETLIGLAKKNGLKDFQAILDRSENAELKEKRPDPGILLPGDKVFIPNKELGEKAGAVDAKYRFKKPVPDAYVRVVIKDEAGQPYAGKSYELEVDGKTLEGQLGSDGLLEQPVSWQAESATLKLWTEDDAEPDVWELQIGYMDPLEEVSGVQARLNNLGFDCGTVDGTLGDATRAAIKNFQWLTGLEETGEIDDALRDKLAAYYEPADDETGLEVAEESEEEGADQAAGDGSA